MKARFEEYNLGTVKVPMLEHVPSDITPQGLVSPAEDISFELKVRILCSEMSSLNEYQVLDKKVDKSDKEKVLKENLKQAKKQQEENKLVTLGK